MVEIKKWKTRICRLQEKKEGHLEISMTVLKELQIRKLTFDTNRYS